MDFRQQRRNYLKDKLFVIKLIIKAIKYNLEQKQNVYDFGRLQKNGRYEKKHLDFSVIYIYKIL